MLQIPPRVPDRIDSPEIEPLCSGVRFTIYRMFLGYMRSSHLLQSCLSRQLATVQNIGLRYCRLCSNEVKPCGLRGVNSVNLFLPALHPTKHAASLRQYLKSRRYSTEHSLQLRLQRPPYSNPVQNPNAWSSNPILSDRHL